MASALGHPQAEVRSWRRPGRACRPRSVAALTRSGVRARLLREWEEGEGAGVRKFGLALLAGPVGWRRPASE